MRSATTTSWNRGNAQDAAPSNINAPLRGLKTGAPKTGKRVRVVALPKELAAILRDHRRALLARQAEDLSPTKLRGLEEG